MRVSAPGEGEAEGKRKGNCATAWWRGEEAHRESTGRLPDERHIHHVGPTCVSGMPAKDIIDLDIECPKGEIDKIIRALSSLGFLHEGNLCIPGREAFAPTPESHAAKLSHHHLYAYEEDAAELHKHLAYRDYLRAHPDRAKWLSEQKIAVDHVAKSRTEYIENKAPFYQVITDESPQWANKAANRTR
jgi:GrpB-like predicted nucleotidyltransferase (UPF0157 family)